MSQTYSDAVSCFPTCEELEGVVLEWAVLRGVLGYSGKAAGAALKAEQHCKGAPVSDCCVPCDPFELFLVYMIVASRCCAEEAGIAAEAAWAEPLPLGMECPVERTCVGKVETLLCNYFMCLIDKLNDHRCFLLPVLDLSLPRVGLYTDAICQAREEYFRGAFWESFDTGGGVSSDPVHHHPIPLLGFATDKCLMPPVHGPTFAEDHQVVVNDLVWQYTLAVLASWWGERRLCAADPSERTKAFVSETVGVLAGTLAGGLFRYPDEVSTWSDKFGARAWIERLNCAVPLPLRGMLDAVSPDLEKTLRMLAGVVDISGVGALPPGSNPGVM